MIIYLSQIIVTIHVFCKNSYYLQKVGSRQIISFAFSLTSY